MDKRNYQKYHYQNPEEYRKIFSNPKWYLILQPKLKEYFYDYAGKKQDKSEKWLSERGELVKIVGVFLSL